MSAPGAVGRIARLLGFAGLLPQVAAVALIGVYRGDGLGLRSGIIFAAAGAMAIIYAAVILSFLGGIWWGFAMRRERGQAALAALSVVPSLFVVAAVFSGAMLNTGSRLALVMLGTGLVATLLVDRHLVTTGEAPAGWMALRVPLSLGLGLLTIAAGALVGG